MAFLFSPYHTNLTLHSNELMFESFTLKPHLFILLGKQLWQKEYLAYSLPRSRFHPKKFHFINLRDLFPSTLLRVMKLVPKDFFPA